MSIRSLLICFMSLGWVGVASAAEIQDGGVYQGPVTLQVPGLNISFKLPAGFTGKATSEGMVIGHKTQAGVIMGTVRNNVSIAEISSELAGPIVLDEGTVLQPKGRPQTKSGKVVATYGGKGVAGFAVARRHSSGRAIAFIGATTPKHSKAIKRSVQKLIKSVKFNQAPKSGGFWKQFLSNKNFKYMRTGGGSSVTRSTSFCSNGRYTYYGSTNTFSQTQYSSGVATVSGAGQSGDRGTWTVSGSQAKGRLTVTPDDGSGPSQFNLTLKDGRLHVGGTRYLHDTRVRVNCN